jgi:hypothetical protein
MAYSPNERGGPASLEQLTSTPFSTSSTPPHLQQSANPRLSNFHPTIFWEKKFDHNFLCLVKNDLITHTHLCDPQIVTDKILKT